MLHSYLKGAKLHALLSCPDCPPTIQECKILLDQIYHTHTHDHALLLDLHDIDSFNNVRVPEIWNVTYVPQDLQELIHQHKAVLCTHVKTMGGVVYSQCSTHLGNSQIFFYPNGNQALPAVPGLTPHCSVETADPFAAYPHFPAKMYSSTLEAKLECVKMSWVISHHAQWAVPKDAVVVLSLCQRDLPTILCICITVL
ncbi:hypothetical protein V8B97DRAFT_2026924 [Scleroderma yunnanense]